MKHDKGEYGGLPAPDAKDPDHGNFVARLVRSDLG